MSDVIEEDVEPVSAARRWTLAGVALAILLVIVFGWLIQSCSAARGISRRFVDAVHQRRMDDAWALATPEVRASSSHLVGALQAAGEIDLTVVQSGFTTSPAHPFSCFRGNLTDIRQFWIVATKLDEGWRVTQLQSDVMPQSCEGSE